MNECLVWGCRVRPSLCGDVVLGALPQQNDDELKDSIEFDTCRAQPILKCSFERTYIFVLMSTKTHKNGAGVSCDHRKLICLTCA